MQTHYKVYYFGTFNTGNMYVSTSSVPECPLSWRGTQPQLAIAKDF